MTPQQTIRLIMLALLAWGVFHAVGAYRFNHNPWRGFVVLACSLVFLGFWGLLLAWRASRPNGHEKRPPSV